MKRSKLRCGFRCDEMEVGDGVNGDFSFLYSVDSVDSSSYLSSRFLASSPKSFTPSLAPLPPHPAMDDYDRPISAEFVAVALFYVVLLVVGGFFSYFLWRHMAKRRKQKQLEARHSPGAMIKKISATEPSDIRQINSLLKAILVYYFGGDLTALTADERHLWWQQKADGLGKELRDHLEDHFQLGESYLFGGTPVSFTDYHQKSLSLAARIQQRCAGRPGI